MIGGGPLNLAAGEWTDHTNMALCLADSRIENGDLDETDLMRRFVPWWSNGENSATGWGFDVGTTTSIALAEFQKDWTPQRRKPKSEHRWQRLADAPRPGRHPPPWRPRTGHRCCPATERHHPCGLHGS
jgi:hypothetical protein